MKMKLLPISAAIAAILSPMSVYAEDLNSTAAEAEKAEQPLILNADTEINTGLVFSGYARYGLHYSDDFKEYVGAEGQLSGASAGRLGNEGNGGEFQFTKAFVADNGAIWDVAVMLEHWSDKVGLKKFYAGVTNVFEAQPNAYLWAGRDFHQRPQEGLNDYFMMEHDGQGGGVYNLDIGSVKLDFAVVAKADSGTGDSEFYAFTSKLHDINLGESNNLSFLFNYGFESDQYDANGARENDDKITAYQLAAVLDTNYSNGSTKLTVRYADNADNSTFNKTEDLTTLYGSFQGNFKVSEKWDTEFLVSYHDYKNDGNEMAEPGNDTRSRTGYSAIVRPMYNWNAVHSTWLEAGYSLVDYENDGENDAWKVTLSQNISFDMAGARPMLRLYATVGEANNEASVYSYDKKQDTLAIGAMFESWW
ncbi:outer membrane protein S [Psychromonas marina]|uniref:Outer membrane protein S n=1 Tax=Psychromonas marina TaxID=88364 RepID=A0ABQ6E054_9GAMM|nr:carbohydrate porin [Psychromonas marina]GLS90806.1 outer membrane protein S [Psychromonas marina]